MAEIKLVLTVKNNKKYITLSYGEESCFLSLDFVSRKIGRAVGMLADDEPDLFYFNNLYMNKFLSEADKAFIYDCFSKIKEDYGTIPDTQILASKVRGTLKQIDRILDYPRLKKWIKELNLRKPDSIPEFYDDNLNTQGLGSEDKTYIQEEYINLMAYTVNLRWYVLFVNQVSIFDEQLKSSLKKDYYLSLARDTPVMNSGEYTKLSRYVISNRKTVEEREPLLLENLTLSLAMEGISQYEIHDHIIKYVIFDIAFHPILPTRTTNLKSKTIVNSIFRAAVHSIQPNKDSQSALHIKTITPGGENGAETQNSTLEGYRVRSDHSLSTVTEINFFYSNPNPSDYVKDFTIYNRLEKILGKELHENLYLDKAVIVMISLVFSRSINENIFLSLSKNDINRYLVIAVAMTIEMGFKTIASLMTSVIDDEDDVITINSGQSQYLPLSNEQTSSLIDIYDDQLLTRMEEKKNMGVISNRPVYRFELLISRTYNDINNKPRKSFLPKNLFNLVGLKDENIWVTQETEREFIDFVINTQRR